jgi:hypothetical protein
MTPTADELVRSITHEFDEAGYARAVVDFFSSDSTTRKRRRQYVSAFCQ